MPDRSIFLHPPDGDTYATRLPTSTRDALLRANSVLQQTFSPNEPRQDHNQLLHEEAWYSSAIEGVHDPDQILLHQQALINYLPRPMDQQSLLSLHLEIMRGQPHSQPGQYRTVQVRIGQHLPPGPGLVPSLMQELLDFATQQHPNPVAHAAWAHLQFETVHPFADGNGRTGRAIINHLLQTPLPISQWIFGQRPTYYHMLARGTWEQYLHWFARGVTHQAGRLTQTKAP